MRRRAARREWSRSEQEAMALPPGPLRDYLLTLDEDARKAGLLMNLGREITGASEEDLLKTMRWLSGSAAPQEQSQ